MDPVTMAIIVAVFFLRRGGENALWAVRGGSGDPPSFRRWQTRQKLKAAAAKTGTGQPAARTFWAHWWQDAHMSADEWRQRKHGRRWEERRRRWQKDDVEREQQRMLAPCVFCSAGRGEECDAGCPEREAHDVDRATGGTPTVPPAVDDTEPQVDTPPSHAVPTVPPAPSHSTPTVPPDRATPDRASSDDRANPRPAIEPNRATVPPATEPPARRPVSAHDDGIYASPGNDAFGWNPDLRPIQGDMESRGLCAIRVGAGTVCGEARADSSPFCAYHNGEETNPAGPDDDLARKRAEKTGTETSTGGNMTTPAHYRGGSPAVHSGEFAGYEATVAGWETIQTLAAQLDAAYETQMSDLRRLKADAQTIGKVATAREANEQHMIAARQAKTDWETRQGAVKETKDATGARGDEALHR